MANSDTVPGMRALYNPLDAVRTLIGGSPAPAAPGPQAVYFNSGPSAADAKAQTDAAAEEAKRKSMAEQANRSGASNTLLTSADSGSDFSNLKTRKTLLGGA
jgi:hypothetical protein